MLHPSLPPYTVTLVGAGPGDPDLLTLKAVKAIAAADVIFVDDLVHADVLQHADAKARIVRVGKRGGCASTPQAFIERSMCAAARSGQRVVRLKGGDPFIFGRGGEEVEHLEAAGLTVHVIPGITSAMGAMASLNTPLTHRSCAQGVVFVTGHRQGEGDEAAIDWAELGQTAARQQLTLVIYMGVKHVKGIARGLRQGLPDHTPVAIVQHATWAQQRHAACTLATLPQTMHQNDLGSPSVLIIGEVTRGLLALAQSPQTTREHAA